MFVDPIVGRFKEDAQLVGLCDSSEVRRSYHQRRLSRDYGIDKIPTYSNFDLMLKEQNPDVVIVCTPDYLHHEFIVRSLEYGADVISEKPLTIDAEKCLEIFEAVDRTGRKVTTTFNLRWTPGISKVKELINQGEIGKIKHVDFEYMLNTSHGADYFRRWHSQKEFSGGLLLHKSTHHFDVINWWLDAIPTRVFAMGDLVFYGKKNAIERGEERLTRYDRYTDVPEARDDPFRFSLKEHQTLEELYLQAESESGYIRDRNVFREDITIEDSMSLLIRYRSGVMVNYSLNAFCPNEGFRVSISGDRGRIEYEEKFPSHIIATDSSSSAGEPHLIKLKMQKLFANPCEIDIEPAPGAHGGGDALLQEQMFSARAPIDRLKRHAGHEQGAASLLIGAAANLSIQSGQAVDIDSLLQFHPSANKLSELI